MCAALLVVQNPDGMKAGNRHRPLRCFRDLLFAVSMKLSNSGRDPHGPDSLLLHTSEVYSTSSYRL